VAHCIGPGIGIYYQLPEAPEYGQRQTTTLLAKLATTRFTGAIYAAGGLKLDLWQVP